MGAIEDAVREEAPQWGPVAESALAACAFDLARRIDAETAATSAAQLHGRLHVTLVELRRLAPPAETADEVDEVTQQREARRRAAGLA